MNSTLSILDVLSDFNQTMEDGNDTLGALNATVEPPLPPPPPQRTFPGVQMYLDTFVFVEIYLYICFAVGIPGNIGTLAILLRIKPINSSYVWLGVMAAMDLLSLLARCFTVPLTMNSIMKKNLTYCIIENIINKWTEHSNYLFLMAMTTERLIAVWFPLKMSVWCSPKRAGIAAGAIIVLTLLGDLHYIETRGYVPAYNECFIKPKYIEFWYEIYIDKIQAILLRLTPMFSVMAMNILIVIGLRRRDAIVSKMSDAQAKEKMKQQKQINRLLTAATLFFFVCLGVENFFRLIRPHLGNLSLSWGLTRDTLIVNNVGAALSVGNHAGNFYLYVIAAKTFRNEFIHLVTCGRYGEHNGTKGTLVCKSMKKDLA